MMDLERSRGSAGTINEVERAYHSFAYTRAGSCDVLLGGALMLCPFPAKKLVGAKDVPALGRKANVPYRKPSCSRLDRQSSMH
jgi:hypothetical protein